MPATGVKSGWESGDLVFKTNAGTEVLRLDESLGKAYGPGIALQKRQRFTAAEVNAGATLLAAVAGLCYRIIDVTMIAIGGNAATATSVDLIATQGASAVRPMVVAVAALTRSAAVKPESANVTLLADGASHNQLDANTAVMIGKQSGGSNLATATHIDVIITYALEVAA